jgi:transposase
LEDAGLKLTSVVSDVMGASGRAMLTALIKGTTDAAVLADLAQGKLRKKLPELRRALEGRFRPHHAFLIEQIFAKIDFLDETMQRLTAELDRRLLPFEPILVALDTIPGVDRKTATIIVAETGADMSRFPSAAHLCSWAAMCPGQNESAGKRRSGKTRKGNPYLRAALIQAALAAAVVTRCWRSPTTSCATVFRTRNSAPTISTGDTWNAPRAATSVNSKRSDSR